MVVRYFDTQLEKFIRSLDESTIARIEKTVDLLEMFGHLLAFPYSKKVHPRLFELRVRGGQAVRIFYTFFNGEAVLLHGFVKKSQRLPQGELVVALRKMKAIDEI